MNNFKVLDLLDEQHTYLSGFNADRKVIENIIQFTELELKNEIWKCVSNISPIYKPYIKEKDQLLYTINNYYISNLGRVAKICKTNKQLLILVNALTDSHGYKRVYLLDYDEYSYLIHRLVAYLFVNNPNLQKFKIINHKNEISIDNRSFNLEWCDNQYNINYGTINKRNSKKLSIIMKNIKRDYTRRKIKCILKDNTIVEYSSLTEASTKCNISESKIFKMCKDKSMYNGYKFEYSDGMPPKTINHYNFNEPIVKLDYNYIFQNLYLCYDDINLSNINNNSSKNLIFKSCKLKGDTMRGGYRWMLLSDYNQTLITKGLKPIIPKVEIVLLTEKKRFKKLYLNAYDIINDGYNLTSVINFCKHRNKSCRDRCWMYLEEYLKVGGIKSLDNISHIDYDALNKFIKPTRRIRIRSK